MSRFCTNSLVIAFLAALFLFPVAETRAQSETNNDAVIEIADLDQTLDAVLAGHSIHGESFNEGPRQSAYLMGGTGSVKFPVTTSVPEVQQFINQGIGQLHGFWYLEAERTFRHAAALDPDCAMAYWGAAMAAEEDRERAAGFISEAVYRIDSVTPRERMYIEALDKFFNAAEAREKTTSGQGDTADGASDDTTATENTDVKETEVKKTTDEYDNAKDNAKDVDKKDDVEKDDVEKDDVEKDDVEKDDVEKDDVEKDDESKQDPEAKKNRATALLHDLESIAIEYPDDIEAKAFVAHRIWFNTRAGIPIGSFTAAESLIEEILEVEPLHPSHHYMIHLWDSRHPENAVQAAARCGVSAPSIAHMWHMPGHIYSRLHRYEDAVYQQGASARVDHAHMIRDRVMPDEISNFAHNNEWLIRNLVFLGRAKEALAMATNMNGLPRHPKYNTIEKGSYNYGRERMLQVLNEFQLFEDTTSFYRMNVLESVPNSPMDQIKYLRQGGIAAAMTDDHEFLTAMRSQLESLLDRAKEQVEQAKGESESDADLPPRPVAKAESVRTEVVYINRSQWESRADDSELKDPDKIIERCGKALQAIEGYEQFKAGEFAAAHESLTAAGDENASWLAEIQMLAGDTEAGMKSLGGQPDTETIPLARLAYWQHQQGDIEAAVATFNTLRDCSAELEIELPVFARLSDVAEAAGHPGDWRKPYSPPTDTGFRPALDSLGPAHWSPPTAPEWELVDSDGLPISSADFAGRPHIIIFFLGHGCLHCVEQINEFADHVDEFEAAGIEMIAISSDDPEGLAASVESFGSELPYHALASDEPLSVFKKFRAHDDFEQQPLHGTFLIDGKGKILWQDISYDPFMDHEFLLKESKRLLDRN